ncbi:Uncharacterised protein [Mycobacteroides abscessus subsp. abscessus]|nr:Uncharacterised protein [Mycobacteroides abscessus subsp. abscessus]
MPSVSAGRVSSRSGGVGRYSASIAIWRSITARAVSSSGAVSGGVARPSET